MRIKGEGGYHWGINHTVKLVGEREDKGRVRILLGCHLYSDLDDCESTSQASVWQSQQVFLRSCKSQQFSFESQERPKGSFQPLKKRKRKKKKRVKKMKKLRW